MGLLDFGRFALIIKDEKIEIYQDLKRDFDEIQKLSNRAQHNNLRTEW